MPDIRLCSRYVAYIDVVARAGDLVVVVASAFLAYYLRFGTLDVGVGYRAAIVTATLLTLLIFPASKIYRSWRGAGFATEIRRVWLAWAGVMLGTLLVGWALKATEEYSRIWLAEWFSGAAVLLAIHRSTARALLRLVRTVGIDTRRVLLVGATPSGNRIVEATRANPWMGLNVIGYIATPYDQLTIANLPSLGTLDKLLARGNVAEYDQLWIALPMHAAEDIHRLNQTLNDSAVTVRFVPDLFGYELLNQQASQIAGLPVITLRGSRIVGYARFAKSVEDRVLAALILALVSPLMVLLAVGVKLSSRGPVFYRQRRVGLDGREFDMLKFRSMPVSVESGGVEWGNAATKQTTRIGRVMRRTSLDELPQFINVLKGEMSIVGPRPERPMFVQQFRQTIPYYMQKHVVKAGITGLAQIRGFRGDTDLAKRVECDMAYIRNWSLWLDLSIIAKTVAVVFVGQNAR